MVKKDNKCVLCGDEVGTTFLDKVDGTYIRIGEGEKSKVHLVCPSCQKKYKEKLKEEVSKV